MSAMAQGLFATLLIGTILKTLGQYTHLDFLVDISVFASGATGMAIGVAIAIALHNIPEGIAVALPIYHATGKKRKAPIGSVIPVQNEYHIAFLFLPVA